MTGRTVTYILLFVTAVALILANLLSQKIERIKYPSLTNNKYLFRIYMVAGYGLLLLVPDKSVYWVILLFLYFLLMRVMQNLTDGLDEEGIYLAGRKHSYEEFETYSMRPLEKTVEFRFYRGAKVRMMEYPNQKKERIERLIQEKGLKKQVFEEIVMPVRRKKEKK